MYRADDVCRVPKTLACLATDGERKAAVHALLAAACPEGVPALIAKADDPPTSAEAMRRIYRLRGMLGDEFEGMLHTAGYQPVLIKVVRRWAAGG